MPTNPFPPSAAGPAGGSAPGDPASSTTSATGGATATATAAAAETAAAEATAAPTKRTRVLLSCHTCRGSKLKCDRQMPCGQCVKRGRPEGCEYAPRPERRRKPPKSMAARLRRLEGMVRGMLDEEGGGGGGGGAGGMMDLEEALRQVGENGGGVNGHGHDQGGAKGEGGDGVAAVEKGEDVVQDEQQVQQMQTEQQQPQSQQKVKAKGQVVQGTRSTSYVGGTHFMAILEDIDELKSYFEDPDSEDDEPHGDPYETAGSPEFFLLSQTVPRNKDELLSLLPDRTVLDRLMMRYFNSNSPSQHILHRPTFSKEYHQFWCDPSSASFNWIAILFMVASLGVFFSSFQAPHELEGDSPMPAADRVKLYRGAAGTALIWAKFSRPSQHTLQGMLLYIEADFLVNRQSQMNCYLLISVLIRLMLKMGLHRDPSKLPNLSPYDSEMRRRMWNLAIQLDLLVSFHLGLPAMIHGIQSDTSMPLNLLDTDFDEQTKALPEPRPQGDYTPLSYPVNKAAICQVFGLVARQAHSLTVPTYDEVMKLDALLEETYDKMPQFMKVKPIEESIVDPPMQVIQRFGIASLYAKSRCVLHRRYITDAVPKKEHAYSRKACLSAALALLEYQNTMFVACRPGAMLSQNAWFVPSLAINDFLLADMIVALVIQSDHYWETSDGHDWIAEVTADPTKESLLHLLKRSLFIWQELAADVIECKQALELVQTVTRKIERHMGSTPSTTMANSNDGTESMTGLVSSNDKNGSILPDMTLQAAVQDTKFLDIDDAPLFRYPSPRFVHNAAASENSWLGLPGSLDWNDFDNFTRAEQDQSYQMPDQGWLDRNPLDDLDFLTSTNWDPTAGGA